MTLYENLPEQIEFHGKRYRLTLWFDHVLAALDILRDQTMLETDRIDTALSFLVRGKYPVDAGLLNAVFDMLSRKKDKTAKNSFDFEQYSALIYAAFWQAYGIDLHEMCGKLHWLDFSALLAGLPENTRFSQVVEIRCRPLPKPTKYNAEEIAQLRRKKAEFALRVSPEDAERALQKSLAGMANDLIHMARAGD